MILGFAAPAFAQSNVTVYGVADVYVQFGKGTATTTKLESGGLSGSRLGFKGTEDLGGGLKAMFQIEHGIAMDTGSVTQGGVFWGRQALVGLGGAFGEVTLGRQYSPHFIAVDDADPFGTGAGSAASSGIVSLPVVRANNSAVYSAPKFGPVSVTLLGALGEGTTGRYYSGYANYSANNLSIGVSAARKEKFGAQVDNTVVLVTAGYDFGVVKVTGGAQRVKNLTQALNTSDNRTEFFGGVLVPVGVGTFSAGIGTGKTKNVANTKATQISLGYDHKLSKRTDLYVVGTGINNGLATAYTADAATGAGPATTLGKDVRALQIGMRHRF